MLDMPKTSAKSSLNLVHKTKQTTNNLTGSVSVTGGEVGGQVNVVSHNVLVVPPPLQVPRFFGLPELGSH